VDHVKPYDDHRITAIGLLAETYSGLVSKLAAQVGEHGIGLVEFEVLLRLSRSPEGRLRMTDLAAQTQLTTSGITRVVDRLERDGLVCRQACATDRRSSYTVINETGRSRVAEILPGHVALIEHWFTGRLTAEQLDQFMGSLRIVRDAVRPGATSGASVEATTGRNTGRT
jgi:MarR family 2-MHQ and catechol resistance regulon transcriptional repressor